MELLQKISVSLLCRLFGGKPVSIILFFYGCLYHQSIYRSMCCRLFSVAVCPTIIRIVVIELIGFIVFPWAFGTIYTTYSRISGVFRKDMFDKAQRLPVSYIEQIYSGDLVSRLTSDFDSAIQLVAYPGAGQHNPFSIVFMIQAIG